MNEETHALHALIHTAKLTSAEAIGLTLGDLNLAGGDPHVNVWDQETGKRRKVSLTEDAKNALIAWLLIRPDRPITLIFPGDDDEGLTPEGVEALLEDYTPPAPSAVAAADAAVVTAQTIAEENLPDLGPLPRKQAPPPFKVAPPPSAPERIQVKEKAPPTPIVPSPPAAPSPEKTTPPAAAASELLTEEAPAPQPKMPPKASAEPSPASKQLRLAILVGGGLLLLLCVGLGIGGFVFLADQLAKLQGNASTTPTPEEIAGVVELKTATPTPGPTKTSTPTETPTSTETPTPTETPIATATATTEPSSVSPVSAPTQTPAPAPPTNTPQPTNTPTPIPTNTPAPTNTSAPAEPPPQATNTPTLTPGPEYAAPELISPEDNFNFIPGNTIDLKWKSVGELAGNEQYAVRLVYFHNSEVVYRGTQLKETQWTVPFNLYHDADGPEYKYTWYVYVEAVQPDGTGISISPESEHRNFIWN